MSYKDKRDKFMQSKPTLIILPGWSGSHETWKDFIALAQNEFDVHCIDLPCFGDEPCPNEVWGVEEYATFVESKVKSLKSKISQKSKFVLLGHSFGGQVAVRIGADHPELFSALILSGAAVVRPFRPFSRAFFYVVAKTGKLLFKLPVIEKTSLWAKKMLYRAARSPDYEKTEKSEIKREIFKKIIRQDLQHLLPSIKLPTLVLWGTLDGYLPLRDGKKIAQGIPDAELKVFPSGRHGLHLQYPKEFLEAITAFVRNRLPV